MRTTILASLLLALGCGGPTPPTDAGPLPDGARPGVDGGELPGTDGGAPPTDAGPTGMECTPTGGTSTADAYCADFHLALIDDGAGSVEARLTGLVSPGIPADGCAVVDSVEVTEGGASIGTFDGVGAFAPDDIHALLARAPALPEMTARCGGDTDRFGGFGFIVRGRMDGGTFEARCADAESGSRWPPAIVITCHENVDARPFGGGAWVDVFGGTTATTIDVIVPHGPSGTLTSVDGTVHVISEAWGFGGVVAPDPFDIAGLDTSVSEGSAPLPGVYSSLSLWTASDPFGLDLCPVGSTGTGPEPDPPPVMILRLTGSGARGAYSSEVYVQGCFRPAPAP